MNLSTAVENKRSSQTHFECLDVIRIDCTLSPGLKLSESAILLEIWECGALVQTSFPIPPGSSVVVGVKRTTKVAAEVTRCETDDDYGYLIHLDVRSPDKWFPNAYVPQWHHPEIKAFAAAS